MDFNILGAFEIRRDGEPVSLPTGRERSLLALLLVHRGEVVSVDRIIDVLWGERPPETASKAVQGYISHLRTVLDDGMLVTRAPGYVLSADQDSIDGERFENLAAEGRRALANGHDENAARVLDEALRLWRGQAFADFAFESFVQVEAQRLEEIKLGAIEDRNDALLRLGRHADLVGSLTALVADHPLRERLTGQLMVVLYRSGRQAEALATYRDAHQLLDAELGLAPTPDLQRLERSILNQDSSLDAPPSTRRLAARPRSRPLGVVLGGLLAIVVVVATVALTRGDSADLPATVINSLVKIDPETNRIVEVVRVGREPVYAAANEDAVWVVNWKDRTVSRVDARTAAVETLGGLATPMGFAFDGPSIWIGSASTNRATRLDAKSLQVQEHLETPVSTATLIAVGAGSLWVSPGPTERGAASVARVRLADGRVQKLVSASNPVGVTYDNGAAWFSDVGTGFVVRIDARTNRVQRIELGSNPLDPVLGFGSVWIPSGSDNIVWRVHEQTGRIQRIIDVGREPWAVAVGAGAVWVTNRADRSVSRIDPSTNTVVATIRTGFRPHWLAVAGDGVWVALAGRRVAG